MVTELAFFTDDPSSNIADAYSFFFRILFKKNENKQKETDVGPFLKKSYTIKEKILVLVVPVTLKNIPVLHTNRCSGLVFNLKICPTTT